MKHPATLQSGDHRNLFVNKGFGAELYAMITAGWGAWRQHSVSRSGRPKSVFRVRTLRPVLINAESKMREVNMSSSSREAFAGRVQFYGWLGAGAVTLGVGAALAGGSGVAHADSTTGSDASQSATSAVAKGHRQSPARAPAKPSRAQSITAVADSVPAARPASLVKTSAVQDSLSDPTTNIQAAINRSSVRRSLVQKPRPHPVALGEAVANAAAVTPKAAVPRAAAAASTSVVRRPAASAEALTPKDQIDIGFDGFNNSIGWIPGVGTVINGVKLAIDVISLASSVITLNAPQFTTELGNIVVDIIGLVPVVGAPVASLIYQTALGGNVKLGRLVQESLQTTFSTDPTWSNDQFQVDVVDVSPGIFGSYSAIATVSTPTHEGVGVAVDITNSGFETGWSVPIEGRLALIGLSLSSGSFFP